MLKQPLEQTDILLLVVHDEDLGTFACLREHSYRSPSVRAASRRTSSRTRRSCLTSRGFVRSSRDTSSTLTPTMPSGRRPTWLRLVEVGLGENTYGGDHNFDTRILLDVIF